MKILKHQIRFLRKLKFHLQKKKRGIILFHSLGTGKTLTALNSVNFFIEKYKITTFYIICPNYLFDIWKNEAKKLSIDYKRYFVFKNIHKLKNILDIKSSQNSIIIIDEAHIILSEYIHNFNEHNKHKIEKLYEKLYSCFFTIYITATPIIKNITDLNIFENLCSNKNLLTNDKNLYPEYYNVNYILYYLFNKILPFLIKYSFKAPYFTIINLITTFLIIYIELYHDSLFDDFHRFMSYLKYKNDFLGINVFLPLKRKIENNNSFSHNINYEKELLKDKDYIEYQKKYLKNENIEKKDGELSYNYIKIKEKTLVNTRISYFIKIIFGIYYSLLTIIELIRNYYIRNNKIVTFNYSKFLKNIKTIDKYCISNTNTYFPKQINHSLYIELNLKQTKQIVNSIINKNFVINNCNPQNEILCNLYNINYDDIPIEKILQISNLFNSNKFNYLLKIITKYKENIVISCRYLENSFNLIKLFLKKNNISYSILKENNKNNTSLIQNFENNEFQVLLLHPKIIEGITINKTKVLVLFDVCIKYNIEQQVIGRCIRYNSHKDVSYKEVQVYKLITKFNKKMLIKILKQIHDPSQSFDELLQDKHKLKFLTSLKSPDQIYEESNLIVENIYNQL